MFTKEIEELYLFQAKEKLLRRFSVVKQDRKSVVLYVFDNFKWILMPDYHQDIKEEDVELYTKRDDTRIMFINKNNFDNIEHERICRKLTEEDRYKFEVFHKACPNSDKQQGMVSLSDPVVYGCFVDGKIVSVASLWNWGDTLSDLGILTHPDYRGKGYGLSVCQTLIKGTNRLYIWRCDVKNEASFSLAKRIGFIETGTIYCLEK